MGSGSRPTRYRFCPTWSETVNPDWGLSSSPVPSRLSLPLTTVPHTEHSSSNQTISGVILFIDMMIEQALHYEKNVWEIVRLVITREGVGLLPGCTIHFSSPSRGLYDYRRRKIYTWMFPISKFVQTWHVWRIFLPDCVTSYEPYTAT